MGKEVGLGMRDKREGEGGERSSRFVVLAFFSVVASSPNLSTFHFSPAKIVQTEWKSKFYLIFPRCSLSSRLQGRIKDTKFFVNNFHFVLEIYKNALPRDGKEMKRRWRENEDSRGENLHHNTLIINCEIAQMKIWRINGTKSCSNARAWESKLTM